jgi:hypothetical protein
MLLFSTPLVNLRLSNLLSGLPPPPPPFPCVNKYRGMYLYSVQRGGGGGGAEEIGLCGEHLQELFTVSLPRFRTYKIALPPKQKPRRGGAFRQINTCRQIPLQVNFKKSRHLGLESISYLVHA